MNIRYPIYEGVYRILTLEFTANINDECFDDRNNWVRAIELPKQE